MRHLIVAALLLCACLTAAASGRTGDHAGIRSVIEDFRTAIIDKDREKFLGLFLHPGVTWQAVTSDAKLEREQQRDPAARKASINPAQTPASFIAQIAADTKANEETFANVVIDSDGDTASVAFDFAYLRDGRTLNVGREYWLLARTEAGWKIAAVTYSRHIPPRTP